MPWAPAGFGVAVGLCPVPACLLLGPPTCSAPRSSPLGPTLLIALDIPTLAWGTDAWPAP
ncbi:hypothetical protein [Nonomuraea rubra]|uniref:Uncharacterized protein n=1 Tax=Nonomuraea rubra TaxID=46180 RepID=A0A7X0NWH5_9ACTN|nr:hypothetical protein [Nonomuraea rubra]MBB6550900.1 hypothetical protein [Nonomuraea rubra]